MRNLDDLEDDPDILDKIQQEAPAREGRGGEAARSARRGHAASRNSALTNLFQTGLARDALGKHETPQKGEGAVRHEDSKPYVYGDSLSNLNLHETLKNAMTRQGGGAPIRVRMDDYVVYETGIPDAQQATVVLVDMSGSMSRWGKYATTKKVSPWPSRRWVRAQYPQDTPSRSSDSTRMPT